MLLVLPLRMIILTFSIFCYPSWKLLLIVLSSLSAFFFECPNLTKIVIPSSVELNDDHSLTLCTQLKEITFMHPSSVTLICASCFKKCISLCYVIFEAPSSLPVMCSFAFSNCILLKEISIPSSLIYMKPFVFQI